MMSNGWVLAQENLILKTDTIVNIDTLPGKNNKSNLSPYYYLSNNPDISVAEKAWGITEITSGLISSCGFFLLIGNMMSDGGSQRQIDFGRKMIAISCSIYCISSIVVTINYLKRKHKQKTKLGTKN